RICDFGKGARGWYRVGKSGRRIEVFGKPLTHKTARASRGRWRLANWVVRVCGLRTDGSEKRNFGLRVAGRCERYLARLILPERFPDHEPVKSGGYGFRDPH